ncbi:MAG: pyridoxamine 5'-phosphate oxidase family protein [Actinomycetota bacterium]
MERDRSGLLVLDEGECLDALARGRYGCVALSHRALPLVLPVSYLVDRGSVVLRAAAQSTIGRTASGSVLSFCAHTWDAATADNWSVVVTGRADLVENERERERLERLSLPQWGDPDDPQIVLRLTPVFMTGRALAPPEARVSAPVGAAFPGGFD